MTASSDIALETRGLTKRFGGLTAVDDIDLRVRRGAIHGLIGPNGAGKTTCFNLLTKKLSPSRGHIYLEGEDISRLKPAPVSRRGLARSFQISAVFADLTVLENVRIALMARQGHPLDFLSSERRLRVHDERAADLLRQVGLAGDIDRRAYELSYGRQRALELATTLALEPRVLLLDEPMAGLGLEDVSMVSRLIREFARGRTVLMVEHNLGVVADLCHWITVMREGSILAEGDYNTVSANSEVVAAYLGTGHV